MKFFLIKKCLKKTQKRKKGGGADEVEYKDKNRRIDRKRK